MITRFKSCRQFVRTLFFLLISLLSGFPPFVEASATADTKNLPFHPGERLSYELRWEFIRAGDAVLEIQPMKQIDGEPVYHFVLTAKSRSFIDNFYKVRDKIDAYASLDMTRSVYYRKDQQEGKTRRDIEVTFDWDNNQAHYSNFGDKREPIDLNPGGAFDPLSAFYFTRGLVFEENTEIEAPVTDGKKYVMGKAQIIRRETITTQAGTFDTFLIEPEIQDVGGVFEKSKDAKIHIWVTADERRIPVRIKSKVVIGSFIGELVSATGLKPIK